MIGVGFIRLILALSVLVTHTHSIFGFTLGNPVIAVRAFFIISGFYMALVLKEKYKSYRLFITNRFLKIYPIYWVVILLSLFLGLFLIWWKGMSGDLLEYYLLYFKDLSLVSKLWLFVSQIVIFGRNAIMYSGFDLGSGNFFWNAKMAYEIPSFPFLMVGQAWTLGLELFFYLIAPFLVVLKKRWIVGLMILSLVSRVLIYRLGIDNVYYKYRFFPNELIFFLLGMMSYHLYTKIKNIEFSKTIGVVGFWVIVMYIVVFQYIKIDFSLLEVGFYLIFCLLLPFVFVMSKSSRLDRTIGEYSYPVYISQGLVMTVLIGLFFFRHQEFYNYMAIVGFVFIMVFSYFLLKFIQSPIDKIRDKRI